jgi:hypothetical protein
MGQSSSKNLKNKIMSEYVRPNYNYDSVNSRTPIIDLIGNDDEDCEKSNNPIKDNEDNEDCEQSQEEKQEEKSTSSFNENFECQFCYEIMVDDQLAKLWCLHYSCYDCYIQIRNSKQISEISKICGICQKPLKLEVEHLDELEIIHPETKHQKLSFLEIPFKNPSDYDPNYNHMLTPV